MMNRNFTVDDEYNDGHFDKTCWSPTAMLFPTIFTARSIETNTEK